MADLPPYEVLDLSVDLEVGLSDIAKNVMGWIGRAKRIVVVAGAGISVAAGIPDFRSSAGLFNTLRSDSRLKPSGKDLFDASVYMNATSTESYNAMITSLHSLTATASPTPFHNFLSSHSSRLMRLYTQNIDSLENRLSLLRTVVPLPSKGPWPKTIQLHGDLNIAVCWKCGWTGSLDVQKLLTSQDGETWGCEDCKERDEVREVVGKRTQGVGRIRPRVVLYNETNPDAEAIGAVSNADLRSRPPPDLLLVVGTSLKIPGTRRIVREMINSVHKGSKKGKCIWINLEPPPGGEFKAAFDVWVKGDCQRIPEAYRAWEEWDSLETKMKEKEKEEEKARKTKLETERREKKERREVDKELRRMEAEAKSLRLENMGKAHKKNRIPTLMRRKSSPSHKRQRDPLELKSGREKLKADESLEKLVKQKSPSIVRLATPESSDLTDLSDYDSESFRPCDSNEDGFSSSTEAAETLQGFKYVEVQLPLTPAQTPKKPGSPGSDFKGIKVETRDHYNSPSPTPRREGKRKRPVVEIVSKRKRSLNINYGVGTEQESGMVTEEEIMMKSVESLEFQGEDGFSIHDVNGRRTLNSMSIGFLTRLEAKR